VLIYIEQRTLFVEEINYTISYKGHNHNNEIFTPFIKCPSTDNLTIRVVGCRVI